MTEPRRRFSAAELQAFRGKTLPDLIGANTRLLFVGINPGLMTVAVQAHFGRRGNRFYPALQAAGIVDHVIDASQGMSPEDEQLLLARGIGITNLVPTASARADELSRGATARRHRRQGAAAGGRDARRYCLSHRIRPA